MDKKSKNFKSYVKIYVFVWVMTIIIITFMYITDYGSRIFNVLTIGILYFLWIIIMGIFEDFRFRNYLKNHHPKIFEQYLNGFLQKLKIVTSYSNLDDPYLNIAKQKFKNYVLFYWLQPLTIPIIGWLGRIIEQIIY